MRYLPSLLILLCLIPCPVVAQGLSYKIQLPQYAANPGGLVTVPLELDNAAGLARIRVQVNFNEQVLSFEEVESGPLGSIFEISFLANDGMIVVDFIRSTALSGGSGRLVDLTFSVNDGATPVNYSDLAIAAFEVGDASGVRDLTVDNVFGIQSGSVDVTSAVNIDNHGNGLPDWWEIDHGLDLYRADAAVKDSDGDGVSDWLEFGLVGNPTIPDAGKILPFSSTYEPSAGSHHLSIVYRRRLGATAPTYTLWETNDLDGWWNLDIEARIVEQFDHGDGTETIEVSGSLPLGSAGQRSFLQLEIQ